MLVRIYKSFGNEISLPTRHIKKDAIKHTRTKSHHGKFYVEITTKDGKQFKSNFFSEHDQAKQFNHMITEIASGKVSSDEADFFLDRFAQPVRVY